VASERSATVRGAGGPPAPRSVSIERAAQILRPGEDGLQHFRGSEQLRAQTLRAGDLSVRDGAIAGSEPDPRAELTIDASGCAVIPGFVDCHTHLPFAGWRAGEYEQKLTGVPYEEISRSGGGIRSSARAFAAMTDEQVLAQATGLAAEMLATGTTTFECKSGYGLERDAELRSLRLARELAGRVPQTTLSTALLAHSVPEGYTPASWMDVVDEMMPEVLELGTVSALDIFVESIAFGLPELERMGALASAAGLALRVHGEQLSCMRSVPVALRAGARSIDHLSQVHEDDIAPLADAQCAAVLLPAAEFLGSEQRVPGRALVDEGAIVVLATDGNPGTAPVCSIPLVIGLAARLYGFGVLETLGMATLNAAWVLEMAHDRGSIEPGKRADLLVLDGPVDSIAYRFGHDPVQIALIGGEPVHIRDEAAASRLSYRERP
jgi:imidazolonepropionase